MLSLALVDLLIALVVISLAGHQLGPTISGNILLFVLTLMLSIVLLYSILLALAAAAFWCLGTPLMWILDSVMQMGRFPIRIYPQGLQLVLMWIIPIGLIVTVPAESLLGRVNPWELVGALCFAVVDFFVSTMFFQVSVGKYASASS